MKPAIKCMQLLRLEDFFAPLNFQNLVILFSLFIIFKAIGYCFRYYIVKNSEGFMAATDWMVGLGIFVFIWFLIGFVIPPRQIYIAISLILLGAPAVIKMIRQASWKAGLKSIWENMIPLIIFSPILNALWIKASLPPYYLGDEMGYHFIPPYVLETIKTWDYSQGGLYQMIPRLVDTFYLLAFSLTKTQAIGRATHALIVLTSLTFIFRLLKHKWNLASALFFIFMFFSIHSSFVYVSTLGLIDDIGWSFLLVALALGIQFSVEPTGAYLIFSFVFWGLALGTKYNLLPYFVSFLILMGMYIAFQRNKFNGTLQRKTVFTAILMSVLFGGYWYLKNLVITGNPIYPFLFPCYKFADKCQVGGGFFGTWTLPITLDNMPEIARQLFPMSAFSIGSMCIIGIAGVLISKNRNALIVSLLCFGTIFLELFILSHFSGFYFRYQEHEQIIALYAIAIACGAGVNWFKSAILKWGLVCGMVYYFLYPGLNRLDVETKNDWVKPIEVEYANGKANIYDFIKSVMPEAVPIARWCSERPDGKTMSFSIYDPDLIWWNPASLMYQYFVNCHFDPDRESLSANEIELLKQAKEKMMTFNLFSINPCMDPMLINKKREEESESSLHLRYVNNILVCHSKILVPGYVYRFDYQDL